MSEYDEAYGKKSPALKRAEAQLRSMLMAVLGEIEDRRLVRVELLPQRWNRRELHHCLRE